MKQSREINIRPRDKPSELMGVTHSVHGDKIISALSTRKPIEIALSSSFQFNICAFLAALMCNFDLGVSEAVTYLAMAYILILVDATYQYLSYRRHPDGSNVSPFACLFEDGTIALALVVNAFAASPGEPIIVLWLVVVTLFVQLTISVKPFKGNILSKAIFFVIGSSYILQYWHSGGASVSSVLFPFTAAIVLLLVVAYWLYLRQVRILHLSFEQEKLQEELELKNRELAEAAMLREKLIRHIGHDLRQPINALRFAVFNVASGDLNKQQREQIDIASNSIDFANYLIEETLTISPYKSTSPVVVNIEEFELGEMLSELEREYRSIVAASQGTLKVVYSSLHLKSDQQIIARILRNFLSNAVRYAKGTKLLLGVRRRRGYLEIQLLDKGPGMSKELLAVVCDEFTQAKNTNSDEGFGLGLNIAKYLAELIHAELHIESEEGRGTLCALKLPDTPAHEQVTLHT